MDGQGAEGVGGITFMELNTDQVFELLTTNIYMVFLQQSLIANTLTMQLVLDISNSVWYNYHYKWNREMLLLEID